MKKINEDKLYSAEDVAWLRQAGGYGVEERIAENAKRFGGDVEDPETPDDEVPKSTLDPNATAGTRVPEGDDDYDQWKVSELEREVKARDEMEGTTAVTVEGTGAGGNITKSDLIKALRIWDAENPGVLDDSDED